MRTSTILLVSLGTAVAAGSTSAAVSGASSAPLSVVAVAPSPGATDTTTPGSSSSVPDTLATPPTGVPVVGSIEPGAPAQQRFVVGEAATVVVDTSASVPQAVVIAAHPGWTISRLELGSDGVLEIRFESPNGEVRFDAAVVDGALVATLDDGDPASPAGTDVSVPVITTPGSGSAVTTPSSGSTATTIDDDDDDDRTSTSVATSPGSGSTATTAGGDDDSGDNRGSGNGGDDDNSGSGSNDSGDSSGPGGNG